MANDWEKNVCDINAIKVIQKEDMYCIGAVATSAAVVTVTVAACLT